VWDVVERDDVMSLDMTDKVMGYQSFQGASTPANVSLNVWKNGRRKGRRVLSSSRHFRPHHSVRQLLALVGFSSMASPPLPQCGCYACSQLVPVSKTGRFGARCAPSTAQGLLWSVCISSFSSAATTRISPKAT